MIKTKKKNRAETEKHVAAVRPPTPAQIRYLALGTTQPGGKLPLFDTHGQRIKPRTIRACIDAGWCREWYKNPIRPDWLVCKLTQYGRQVVAGTKMP